jgi:hypothetical protein
MFIEDITLQLILAKPNDLVTNEPTQTQEPEPLPIELEDFQHVGFELINNHLTHGNIKRTYVHLHYYHDAHVEDNNAIFCNDQNDAINEVFIDVHILKVYNLKGHVYSQPHGCYWLK